MLYLENLEPRCLLSVYISDLLSNPVSAIDFGDFLLGDQSPDTIIQITHDNIGSINVTDIRIEKDGEPSDNFFTLMPTLPAVILPGESLDLSVSFTPQEINVNGLDALLIIETTDGDTPEKDVRLEGNALDVRFDPDYDPDNVPLLHFFSTGVGQFHDINDFDFRDPEIIRIEYSAEMDTPLYISDLQVTGDDCFSYEQPAPPETLPSTYYYYYDYYYDDFYYGTPDYTANEVVELEIGVPEPATLGTELDASGTPILDRFDIYSFTAQPGQIIEVDALLENYGDLTIQVYSAGGQLLAWDSEIEVDDYYSTSVFTNVVFPVPGNPAPPGDPDPDEVLYYVEVEGHSYVDPDTYQIMVSTSEQTIPEISFAEDPLVPSYEGIIGNDQLYDEEIQWLQFDADFGDQIDLRFEYDHPFGSMSEPLYITIFDKNGRALSPETDFPANPDVEGISYTLISEGPFYLRVNNMDLGRYEYEITLVELGSILELEPGESLELPIYYRPDSLGDFSGSFILNTSSIVAPFAQFDLHGKSYTGDLVIPPDNYMEIVDDEIVIVHYTNNISVPNVTVYEYADIMFPYAQSGAPLDVVATVTNEGGGDIQQSADLVYYLSTDDIYSHNDICLSPSLQINHPLFSGNSDVVSGSVNIPSGLEGEYYLIAVVDPLDQVLEVETGPPDIVPIDYWWVDPVIVADELETLVERLIIAPENLLVTDSVGYPFIEDENVEIDFGERPLNTFNTEYVFLFNRGDSPVSVTDYSLKTGDVFQFPEPGSPDYQAPPILIMPGQTANIPVIFAPETFPTTGDQIHTDVLTVQTSERALPYEFDLKAELAGANLIVLDNLDEGKVVNQMDLGTVRVDNSSEATFFLVNLGDQDLYINSIDFNSGNLTAFSYSLGGGEILPITLEPFDATNDDDTAEFLLTFTPNYTGDFTDTLIIHSSDTTGDYTIQLAGVGVSPALVVEESQGLPNDNYLPFGWQPLNQPASTSIILSNAGTDILNLKGWEFETNAFEVNIPNHPNNDLDNKSLQPGESLTLIITFPATEEGSFNDTFTISSDDGKYEVNLSSLAGQSAMPSMGYQYNGIPYDPDDPDYSDNPLILDIGNVPLGQSASELFYIVNNGKVELSVDSISVEGAGFSLVDVNLTQPEILKPAGKIPVLVKFDATPNLPIKSYEAIVIIQNTAQQMAVPVSAAIVNPEIDVSSTFLDFGAIDESQQKTLDLQISNSGNTDLIITDYSAQNPQFSIKVPPQNLSDNNLVITPYQTITVAVTFDPQQYGATQTQFNLLSNDYDEPISTVTLSAYNLGRPFKIQPNTTYPFYDADGDLVKVSLTEGRAILYLEKGLLNHADINTLRLYDTTPNTDLKITVSGGQTSINSIKSEDSLHAIKSSNVTINQRIDINDSIINGSIDINGSLDELLLNNIADGTDIHVAQYSSKPMTVKVEKIGQQVTFDLASNVKTFQASSYDGGNLTAPQMDLLKITNGSLGANVSLGSGSLKKLDVYNHITGNVHAFDSIGKAASKTGGIFGTLTAQTGGINNVTAKKNITGNIFAANNVDKVISKQGTFAATLRAENVNKIIARNIDGALVSTADDIGKVITQKDVRDSFFLAGYDISMNGLDEMNDNDLSGGSVKNFKYGRELSNTYVAAGVITDTIYQALTGELPDFQLSISSYGSININGKIVQTESGATEFGFFAVDDISTNLEQQDNFIIAPNL